MSKKSDQLVREIAVLVETTEAVRDVLGRYKRANAKLAKRIERGESVLEAFDGLAGTMRRHRELTEALAELEAARHQVRVALFALSTAQGVSLSEVGRRLGISRQLASRLAAEAEAEKR
jgi:DNA-directed RNA polymerase sigma subunit (sigma70/sigma32)